MPAVLSSMSPLPMPAEDGGWLVLSLAFALGACIGSFLNVYLPPPPGRVGAAAGIALPALRYADRVA